MTGRRNLRVKATTQQLQDSSRPGPRTTAVMPLRRSISAIDSSTVWWFTPLETFLSILVGIVDAIGTCTASVAVGATSQFFLLICVWRFRPRGDCVAHCITWINLFCSPLAIICMTTIDSVTAVQAALVFTNLAMGASLVEHGHSHSRCVVVTAGAVVAQSSEIVDGNDDHGSPTRRTC